MHPTRSKGNTRLAPKFWTSLVVEFDIAAGEQTAPGRRFYYVDGRMVTAADFYRELQEERKKLFTSDELRDKIVT